MHTHRVYQQTASLTPSKTSTPVNLLPQPGLHLLPLRIPHIRNLLPRRIKRHMRLVKRILIALLKLLLHQLDALLPPQPGMLLLDLRHAARLVRRIRRLVPTLRMAVDLGRVLIRQAQGVQRVINTRGVERGALLRRRRAIVQLRQVQAARLLGRLLGVGAFALRGLRGFLGGEEGVAFGLFARGFGFFGFGVISG